MLFCIHSEKIPLVTYSKNVSRIVEESSICKKPRIRIAHSVANVTMIKVNPSEEKPYRLRKVIKNPNPPISIIWMSIITAIDNIYKMIVYNVMSEVIKYKSRHNLIIFVYIHGYFSKFSLSSSFCFPPCN